MYANIVVDIILLGNTSEPGIGEEVREGGREGRGRERGRQGGREGGRDIILCDGNYGVGVYGIEWEPERSRVTS